MIYARYFYKNILTTIDLESIILYIDNCEYEVIDLLEKYEAITRVFKALSDPNRLIIVEMLQGGEKCACQLLDDMHISQSTLSHHMKILCESGVVDCRREGKWMFYSLSKTGCEAAQNILTMIMEASTQSNVDEKCCP